MMMRSELMYIWFIRAQGAHTRPTAEAALHLVLPARHLASPRGSTQLSLSCSGAVPSHGPETTFGPVKATARLMWPR